MSGGRIGGTTEQMQGLGGKFQDESHQVQQLVTRVTSQLDSTDWEGGAAQRFRDQWHGEFKGVLQKVSEGLMDCSQEVKRRADGLQQVGG